jgi:hypothetical protein
MPALIVSVRNPRCIDCARREGLRGARPWSALCRKSAADVSGQPRRWNRAVQFLTSCTAVILLKRCFAEAGFVATRRADTLLDQGDVQGSSAWVRSAKAMTDLERKRLRTSERVQ